MFGEFLLDQGVEMELQANIGDVLNLLDKEVTSFSCDGIGFCLTGFNGRIGSKWKMLVKPYDNGKDLVLEPPIGYIEVAQLDQELTGFKIPPKSDWNSEAGPAAKEETKRFTSFIFQLFNSLQVKGLMNHPGQFPVI